MLSSLGRRPLASSVLLSARYQIVVSHPQMRYNARHSEYARSLFTRSRIRRRARMAVSMVKGTLFTLTTGGIFYAVYQNDRIQPFSTTRLRSELATEKRCHRERRSPRERSAQYSELDVREGEETSWDCFTSNLATFASVTDLEWNVVTDTVADFIMPQWAKVLPGYINKLQKELSMAPGSLADEIWIEAHDPELNPEIEFSASVRVSSDLCDEEKSFLEKRRVFTKTSLAKYLGIPENEVNIDDIPCIAMVSSGGGLRALVAGTASMLAAYEDGLFDCVTYTAGVSGSCWLQALFHSSLGGQRLDKLAEHLKARLGIHIAYPPVALSALNTAPTNKYLLRGFVEKLRGDPRSDFGLVDAYGLLLAARLLVPKGELAIDDNDMKISSQRQYIKDGQNPMPIYTAVRHEIPLIEEAADAPRPTDSPSEETKEKAKREAWFQWFEITPYELFCEEFAAGIPTFAMGRRFINGHDIPESEDNLRVPEVRLPLLLGMFGSAFCATLSHYYKEIRPLVKGLVGFGSINDMLEERDEDLSKVHPIDPASIPNFAYGMKGRLAKTTPESIYQESHLRLMDAGMSNNLPIYPLLRPGRDVDILIAFDASADVKQDNWLSVADGYARQRGVKGWPIGVGWPKANDTPTKAAKDLEAAETDSATEAELKVQAAKEDQTKHSIDISSPEKSGGNTTPGNGDLGYCTVWVGTTEERSSPAENVPSKAVSDDWEPMEPNSGIAIIYFPFLPNPDVPDVDPMTSEYMSTWNFVYTHDNVDSVMKLARANWNEGREQTKRCVRAVYEKKKAQREERESKERKDKFRRKLRKGIVGKLGDGDHFS